MQPTRQDVGETDPENFECEVSLAVFNLLPARALERIALGATVQHAQMVVKVVAKHPERLTNSIDSIPNFSSFHGLKILLRELSVHIARGLFCFRKNSMIQT